MENQITMGVTVHICTRSRVQFRFLGIYKERLYITMQKEENVKIATLIDIYDTDLTPKSEKIYALCLKF